MDKLCEERLKICSTCPLFKKQWDGNHRCDGQKYLDPTTMKTSYLPKKGWIRGCGCICEVKCKNPNIHCVAGLW